MSTYKDFPLLILATVEEWRMWLDTHHASEPGVWVAFAKKDSGATTLSYIEARDTAIAYGWIDGLINKYDETYSVRRFTPRTAKSGWSKVNTAVAEGLIAAGTMHAAGRAQVDAAKSDGRWERAYDSSSTIQVSPEFQQALDKSPGAREFFEGLNRANRYAFLYRLQTAKNDKTRTERIIKYIEMLENGESFH